MPSIITVVIDGDDPSANEQGAIYDALVNNHEILEISTCPVSEATYETYRSMIIERDKNG